MVVVSTPKPLPAPAGLGRATRQSAIRASGAVPRQFCSGSVPGPSSAIEPLRASLRLSTFLPQHQELCHTHGAGGLRESRTHRLSPRAAKSRKSGAGPGPKSGKPQPAKWGPAQQSNMSETARTSAPSLSSPPPTTAAPAPAPFSSSSITKQVKGDSIMLTPQEVASLVLPPGPPESEAEAVAQAGRCLGEALALAAKAAEPMTLRQRQALGARAGKRAGGSSSSSARRGGARIQVEVPVRDDSPGAQASLVQQLLSGALGAQGGVRYAQPQAAGQDDKAQLGAGPGPGAGAGPSLALFFPTQAAADAAQQGQEEGAQCFCLSTAQVVPKEAELVLVLGPAAEQAQLVQAVLGSAGQRPVVLVNPSWAGSTSGGGGGAGGGARADTVTALEAAFEVAYCFMPLAFQGLLGSSMGALVCAGAGWDGSRPSRETSGSSSAGVAWVLFKQQGKESKRVAVLRRRPGAEELQTLLYANMAAESPVSKSIQFFRSLLGQAA